MKRTKEYNFNGIVHELKTKVVLPIEECKELINETLFINYGNRDDENRIKSSRVFYKNDINTAKYRDQYAKLLQALFGVNNGDIFMFSNNTSKLGYFYRI